MPFDVIHVQEGGRLRWNYALQFPLTSVQRHRAEVFAVELQDVEGVEIRLPTPIHEPFELTLSPVIKADDLDAALAWAAKATRACAAPIEVRPFQEEPEA